LGDILTKLGEFFQKRSGHTGFWVSALCKFAQETTTTTTTRVDFIFNFVLNLINNFVCCCWKRKSNLDEEELEVIHLRTDSGLTKDGGRTP
jgi:hypothetical protein